MDPKIGLDDDNDDYAFFSLHLYT